MPFIGRQPVIGNFQKCDSISVVNGQAAYTLQVGGVNVSPQSENHMLVSLNGILQSPVDSFTVSGSTLTFASNLVTGDVIDFVMILGNVLDLGVPSDNTVSLAKLTATGTKDATTFLRGDNTFAEIPAGGITMAQQYRITANITSDANPITSNWEEVDTDGYGTLGTGMSLSSGRFTFPSTGYYLITLHPWIVPASGDNVFFKIETTTDNSNYDIAASSGGFGGGEYAGGCSFIFDVTNTSTHKVSFGATSIGSGSYVRGETAFNATHVTFVRLGDT